jgi:chaperone LolA
MKFALKVLSTVAIAVLPLLAEAGAVDQLHQFLNSTRTLRAEFSQMVVAKNGRKPQQSSGVVAISRPGKLRWDIQKPYPQLVVGDGEKIWIYDAELKQVTVRKAGQAISGSPAALLAGSNELEKNFTLSEAGEADGMNWVEATDLLKFALIFQASSLSSLKEIFSPDGPLAQAIGGYRVREQQVDMAERIAAAINSQFGVYRRGRDRARARPSPTWCRP